MPGRGDISWKTRTLEGERREVSARRHGKGWQFRERGGRYEPWQVVKEPNLEDWLKLLDGVERRVPRRLCDPGEPARIRRLILRDYPEAEV